MDSRLLKDNIAKSIKQVNVVAKRCPSGLTLSEVQLLLQATGQSKHGHAKRNYALLHLMLQTGLRVNEVAIPCQIGPPPRLNFKKINN